MIRASLLPRAAALCAAVVLVPAAPARAATSGERTPVSLGSGGHASHVGSSGSIVRTIVGLAVVIGVIYGVAWVLRQVKAGRVGRATGAGLAALASVPLGSGRAVHLVRAGRDYLLVGVGEHGVTPLRAYSELEAHAAGLIDDEGNPLLDGATGDDAADAASRVRRRPRFALDTLRAWTVRA